MRYICVCVSVLCAGVKVGVYIYVIKKNKRGIELRMMNNKHKGDPKIGKKIKGG